MIIELRRRENLEKKIQQETQVKVFPIRITSNMRMTMIGVTEKGEVTQQCDQTLEQMVAQFFLQKLPKSNDRRFYLSALFKFVQMFDKYLGYFCTKICHQELSKIAQSGHTGTAEPTPTNGAKIVKHFVNTCMYLLWKALSTFLCTQCFP